MFNQIKNLIIKGNGISELDEEKRNDIENLLVLCRENLPSVNEALIIKAFQWCVEAHRNKVRKSGQPYYTHPVAVAKILVSEMPLDDISVASALLHDILDYSDKYSEKDLRTEFGSTIYEIVIGISKIRHVEGHGLDKFEQIDNYERLLLSMFKDVRIILIKLADRLHNMRTLEHLPPERQKNIAKETLEIYSHFAHRFGLGDVKWELEDLAFKHLHKEAYDEIKKSIHGTRKERENYIKKFTAPIKERLNKDPLFKQNGIKFEISGRPKHIYSTYNKLKQRGLNIEDLNDLFAVRIILETDDQNLCFYAYGAICELYKPVPQTFKNYVYTPKKNGYQSIHTAVVGPGNRNVEVQLRTRKMHKIAEKGVAAHFRYKKGPLSAESLLEDKNLQKWLDSIREIFENKGVDSPQELMESVRQNLFQDEIYVFTPANELRILPKDSTPLDFAFDIHTEVGSHCIGAKVNGKIVPFDYKLQSGDQIKILTSERQQPAKEWLNFVVTSRARSAIHKDLKIKRRKLIDLGEELWSKKVAAEDIILSDEEFQNLYKSFNFKSANDFYEAVGNGTMDLEKNFEFILYKLRESTPVKPKNGTAIHHEDEKVHYTNAGINIMNGSTPRVIASCCYPLPGDPIMAVYTASNELYIHRKECKAIQNLILTNSKTLMEVDWQMIQNDTYTADIRIIGEDRPGILSNLTNIIIEMEDTNIKGVTFDTYDSVFDGVITVNVKNLEHLKKLFEKLYNVHGIKSIERLQSDI